MKKILATLGACAMALALVGCGSGSDPDDGGVNVGSDDVARVVIVEGVQCIAVTGYRSTAISCNWEAYNND